jgi:multiple sugar transport system permease protein
MGYDDMRNLKLMSKISRFLDKRAAFFFVSPAMIVMIVITMFPLVFSYFLSLTDFYMIKATPEFHFIGGENYMQILQDTYFWESLRITLTFVVLAVALEFIFGLILALVFNKYTFRGIGVLKTLVLIPMMITPIVAGLSWSLLYNPDYGLIDYFLTDVFRVCSKPILWLSSPETALLSVIIVDVWQWTPFVTLMLTAGLSSLPREPFEAAEVDGASSIQKFRFMTLPLLSRTILFVLLIRAIDAFKVFDIIFVLTGGGPGFSTTVLSYQVYLLGLKYFRIGSATTLSIIMSLIISLLATIYIQLLYKERRQ